MTDCGEFQHPFYVCPRDRSLLSMGPHSGSCPACHTSYPIEQNILLLDSMQRPDREAFNSAAARAERLTPEQLVAADRKAEALLARVGVDRLNGAAVLDLGCGFGDLTSGLVASGRLANCNVYAIDHSVGSLRVLLNSASPRHGNRVHVSAQDASALCFPDSSFDLIAGSAVLHHVLDYKSLLAEVFRRLRPGGKAVFIEPFLDGYFLVSLLLNIAVRQSGLSDSDLARPEFGMCRFILDDIAYRAKHKDDLQALDHLVDKHLFRDEGIGLGYSLGFKSVSFSNYEPPEFYETFMEQFLSEYEIRDPTLVAEANRCYKILRDMMGNAMPEICSHAKYMVFTK